MNAADKLLVEQIKTKPWRDLSLCGASIAEARRPGRRAKDPEVAVLQLELAWVEAGEVGDEYSIELKSDASAKHILDILREVIAFARGAIPVAWGPQSKGVLHSWLKEVGVSLNDDALDMSLCFLLRPKSRWLDPMIWTKVRTGKIHPLDTILRSVGIVKSHSRAIDVAALAYQLPTRDGFPVEPQWTASETAEWQELQRVF